MIGRDPALASLPVIDALESLSVPYYISGSVASTHLGVARSTVDVDIVAMIGHAHVTPLVKALQDQYYIDSEMIEEAINARSSFNLIHMETMTKVDIFVPEWSPDQEAALTRARRDDVFAPESDRKVFVASPEDVILSKLKWFKMTGEHSERQWNDVQGVLSSQSAHLDRAYLTESALKQGISDLLARSMEEAGI